MPPAALVQQLGYKACEAHQGQLAYARVPEVVCKVTSMYIMASFLMILMVLIHLQAGQAAKNRGARSGK